MGDDGQPVFTAFDRHTEQSVVLVEKMKSFIFILHTKSNDGVQLFGDEQDVTKLERLREIVASGGRWQGYSGEELLDLADGWHELEIPKHL